jgi:hypothetical protein
VFDASYILIAVHPAMVASFLLLDMMKWILYTRFCQVVVTQITRNPSQSHRCDRDRSQHISGSTAFSTR